MDRAGTAKGEETVVLGVRPAEGERGPRFLLRGAGEKEFIRMNSNSYLGLALRPELLHAEEEAARRYGVGPGAVRFISGTYAPHVELEEAVARFHGRDACMITSAAYTSVLGVIVSLTTPRTIILSDELNHNCIINAMKLARPLGKKIFPHLDLNEFEAQIEASVGEADGLLVVTDGVFSMRGDFAPLKEMAEIVRRHNDRFPRDIVLVVDDSHGVGSYGRTGRGTEEVTGATSVDVIVATLGKAFGVNGGYTVADARIIRYLREKNPFYIYTNPITPSEAAAALTAVTLLQSEEGGGLLAHLLEMTQRFEKGLLDLGYETIPSEHPVVPLLVRDTARTNRMVRGLRDHGVLATGLSFPVVPKGDELIRFQVCADHTPHDIDSVLGVLKELRDE
ncbi:aminotransferase class I/II-fold pyridoxal phosphate-dependent enzyme [Planctomycetota bacterium]